MASPLFLSPQPFRPATSSAAGLMGLVPSPAAGQQTYFLRGDGTWSFTDASTLTGTALASNVVSSSLTSLGVLSALTVTAPIIGSATVLTRNDGQYHHILARSSAFARSYGLAINSGTGEFILDDITAGATRFRVSPSGTATIAGGLENTPLGATTPNTGAFTTLIASGRFGVNGVGAVSKPTITGSRGGNAALASLLTALASYGLITDSTT
jgi:hypothetical protein